MKLNEIDEVWNSVNPLLSNVLVCCHPKMLLPWQRDVTTSPLYTRKGYYTNQFLLKRLHANFNWQFVYAALKYASQLGFVIGDTWKYNLYITNIFVLNNVPSQFTMSSKGKLAIWAGFFSTLSFLDWFSASTEVSMEMAKNDILQLSVEFFGSNSRYFQVDESQYEPVLVKEVLSLLLLCEKSLMW